MTDAHRQRAAIEDLVRRAGALSGVEAVVHAGADDVRPKIGQWATIEDLGDGRCTLRMTADSLDWPTLALGTIGAEFEVLTPPELADHIREWGARFTRAVGT